MTLSYQNEEIFSLSLHYPLVLQKETKLKISIETSVLVSFKISGNSPSSFFEMEPFPK